MSFVVGTALLAVVTALACALPGVFVVLRRSSMLVDAIGHAVLPGIVVGYFFTRDLDSPLLIIGAALAGLVGRPRQRMADPHRAHHRRRAAGTDLSGAVQCGVILVTLNFANVHLDTHAVLVGDLNLAAWEQLIVNGTSIGPAYLYVMLGVLALNIIFLGVFHTKLKVTTFDAQFATSIGIRAGLVNAVFMFLVSLTVTAAFDATGAILVIALMIVPPATAYLLSQSLPAMITLTAVIAVAGALAGFWTAYVLDAATSAGMAVFYGLVFVIVLAATRIGQRRRQGIRALAPV